MTMRTICYKLDSDKLKERVNGQTMTIPIIGGFGAYNIKLFEDHGSVVMQLPESLAGVRDDAARCVGAYFSVPVSIAK